MINTKAKIPVFVSLLFALLATYNTAIAGKLLSLYDVEIAVVDEAGDTRWRAFTDGLDEVFVRISGDSIVMDKLKRPPASKYVKQFSYEPIETSTSVPPLINAKGEVLSYRLKIQYNGSAMEKYLLANGFAVWGRHRPDVVIWLAVRDGSNEYVLKANDQSLLKTAADEALARRGIPERWPKYDSSDRKILRMADIRGGFKEPVIKASKRYSRGPALAGSLLWNGTEWQSSWSLMMGDADRHWSLVDANYASLISKAIDQAADALGVVFAVRNAVEKQQLVTIQLDIQAVTSIEKYHFVEKYLSDLDAVDAVKPLRVDAENAVFEVSLKNNQDDFLDLLKNDAAFVKVAARQIKQDESMLEQPVMVINNSETTTMHPVEENTADLPVENIAIYYYRLHK